MNARAQVGQMYFFFCAGEEALVLEAVGDCEEEVKKEDASIVSSVVVVGDDAWRGVGCAVCRVDVV